MFIIQSIIHGPTPDELFFLREEDVYKIHSNSKKPEKHKCEPPIETIEIG